MPKGKPYTAESKAKVTLEALQGARTVGEMVASYELNPNMAGNWEAKAESDLSRVFSVAGDDRARERELAERRQAVGGLRRKAGEPAAERDYLQRGLLARYGIDIEEVSSRPDKR